jgi:competence ComEA-like helix-hairpin-helix protein
MNNLTRDRTNGNESQHGHATEDAGPLTGQNLDLNHATWQQLSAIDGIDELQAQAIVEYRTFNGHFLTWEALAAVPGMDPERVAQVQHFARIGGTETPAS